MFMCLPHQACGVSGGSGTVQLAEDIFASMQQRTNHFSSYIEPTELTFQRLMQTHLRWAASIASVAGGAAENKPIDPAGGAATTAAATAVGAAWEGDVVASPDDAINASSAASTQRVWQASQFSNEKETHKTIAIYYVYIIS